MLTTRELLRRTEELVDNDEKIQSAAAVPRTSALWIMSRRMRMSREETIKISLVRLGVVLCTSAGGV